jgi:hypothetical protein
LIVMIHFPNRKNHTVTPAVAFYGGKHHLEKKLMTD